MKRKKPSIKLYISLLVILVVIIGALAVTPTLARYIRGAADNENKFQSTGSVEPKVINGTLDEDGTMKDVCVQAGNTGYPVYIRVEVLITWQAVYTDDDGNEQTKVLYVKPEEDEDYTVSYNTDDWKPIDVLDEKGNVITTYYYFMGAEGKDYLKGVVKSGGKTSNLIESFSIKEGVKAPYDGYTMNVEVIVQTVQAVGKTDEENGEIPAWWDAWGFEEDPFAADSGSSGTDGD